MRPRLKAKGTSVPEVPKKLDIVRGTMSLYTLRHLDVGDKMSWVLTLITDDGVQIEPLRFEVEVI